MHPGVNSWHNVRSLPAGLWCLVKTFCMNAIICMNLTKPVKSMAFLFPFLFVIKYSQSFWQVSWDSSIYCGVCYYDCRKIQDLACWEQKQRGVQCLSEQITSQHILSGNKAERQTDPWKCIFIGTTLITIKCKLITQAISLAAASRGGRGLGEHVAQSIQIHKDLSEHKPHWERKKR